MPGRFEPEQFTLIQLFDANIPMFLAPCFQAVIDSLQNMFINISKFVRHEDSGFARA